MLLSFRYVLAMANKPGTPSFIHEPFSVGATVATLLQAGHPGGQACIYWVHMSVLKPRTLLSVRHAKSACTWRNCRASQISCCMSSQSRTTAGTT